MYYCIGPYSGLTDDNVPEDLEFVWGFLVTERDSFGNSQNAYHELTIESACSKHIDRWQPPTNLQDTYTYQIGVSPEIVIDIVATNADCFFNSSIACLDSGPGACNGPNKWGFVPSDTPVTATITQVALTVNPDFPRKVLSTADGQFRFSTDDPEWEGEWTFVYESSDDYAGEAFTHEFTIIVVNNPCTSEYDSSVDGTT